MISCSFISCKVRRQDYFAFKIFNLYRYAGDARPSERETFGPHEVGSPTGLDYTIDLTVALNPDVGLGDV